MAFGIGVVCALSGKSHGVLGKCHLLKKNIEIYSAGLFSREPNFHSCSTAEKDLGGHSG